MIRKLTTKLKRILIPIERMLSVIRRDRLTVYAGQASYFVLMSSVPLVMLLVSLFGAIYPLDGDAILALTAEFLPEQLRDFGGKLLSGVFNTSAVPLASVSTVVLLWAASRGIRTIGDGIQNIFDEGARRSYVRNVIVSLLYTLAFLMLILLALLLLMLWLNILMVILLFGAELNKWRRAGKIARGAKKRSRKPDSPLEEET